MTILYLVPLTLLFFGDRVRSEDNGLILEGVVCDASNDPCLECYACSEFGRCVQIMGCMASEEEPPADSAPEAVQPLPGSAEGADGVDEVESSPVDEAPIEVVDASPEAPVEGSSVDEAQDEEQAEVERVADTLDKSFGANGKGEGVIGSSNTMGDCKYDGSLGMSAESKEYQAECMRLNMAECIMGGSHGACTYVAAEGSAIGCMWDGTGCGQGCIPANMVSRCAELSHDLEACEGEQGQELRCKWSKPGTETMGMGMPQDEGAEESMPYPPAPAEGAIPDAAETMGLPPHPRPKLPKAPAAKTKGEKREELSLFDGSTVFKMERDLSSRDIVIVVMLAVATLTGLYQLYQCCVNWKLHREYKLVNTSDRAARPSHCIIDGQAYF